MLFQPTTIRKLDVYVLYVWILHTSRHDTYTQNALQELVQDDNVPTNKKQWRKFRSRVVWYGLVYALCCLLCNSTYIYIWEDTNIRKKEKWRTLSRVFNTQQKNIL